MYSSVYLCFKYSFVLIIIFNFSCHLAPVKKVINLSLTAYEKKIQYFLLNIRSSFQTDYQNKL